MHTEAFNAGLPPAFGSWYQLWNKWVEMGGRPGDIFKHDNIDEEGYHKQAFTMDYVKARCFDEQCADPFTFHELRGMEMAAKEYSTSAEHYQSFNNKITNHKQLAIKLKLI